MFTSSHNQIQPTEPPLLQFQSINHLENQMMIVRMYCKFAVRRRAHSIKASLQLFFIFLSLCSSCESRCPLPAYATNPFLKNQRRGGVQRYRGSIASSNNSEKEGNQPSPNLAYKSRSTSSPDGATYQYHAGSEERKEKLHKALIKIGISPDDFIELPEYKGSAALRTYTSFLFPKSAGALAMTEQPQRAAVVANNIAFLLKEHRSHQEEWLRNHDRALEEMETDENGNRKSFPIILVLDNVRSAHNVGNILRAAEAAKCDSVILCGSMTPSPPHPKVLKTALGAAEFVPIQKNGSTLDAIRELKQRGVKVFGVETTSRSIPLWKASFFDRNDSDVKIDEGRKAAFVFGNEMIGVDTNCLEECDEIIVLPTHGVKNSLNVATCASVVIWEALRQWDVVQENKKIS